MIRLIASDLDGTLLKKGAQKLSPEVFELIPALKEKGIYFVAASGRQYANMRRLFAPLQDEISYPQSYPSVLNKHTRRWQSLI